MRIESVFRRGHATFAAARRIGIAAALLVLALAGAGFCAQPLVGMPLPEAALLGGVDGKLLHADANDTWWFELTSEFKNDVYQIPAGTRFVLLPAATLERLIVDANDRYTPQYRLAAQVTRYRGANYLLATYFLPLSTFKSDGKTGDGGRKAEDGTGRLPAGPGVAIPPEIVEQLKNGRPVRGPLTKPGTPAPESKSAGQDYLGRMFVDRVGIIEAAGVSGLQPPACGQFIPYALGWNVSSIRYELLPCSALEQALQIQRGSMEAVRFNVAGLVTQFRGRQFLLLQRAAPVYNYGNFGR